MHGVDQARIRGCRRMPIVNRPQAKSIAGAADQSITGEIAQWLSI
jgi:hypothetical protein